MNQVKIRDTNGNNILILVIKCRKEVEQRGKKLKNIELNCLEKLANKYLNHKRGRVLGSIVLVQLF